MKASSLVPWLALLAGLACIGTSDAQSTATPRLTDISATIPRLTPVDRAYMEKRQHDPSIEWIMPIGVNPEALDHDRFDAYLYDRHVSIRKNADEPIRSASSSGISKLYTPEGVRHVRHSARRWRGEVALPEDRPDQDHAGLRDVSLSHHANDSVSGSIKVDASVYMIERLPAGGYVLVKQDLSKLRDH